MKSFVTLVLLLTLFTTGRADEASTASRSATKKKVAGGVLLGVSATAAAVATGFGIAAAETGGGCGGSDDPGCTGHGVIGASAPVALGLAIGAAVTAAIGIPLVVSARNDEKRVVKLSFGAAPTTGGATAALQIRF